MTVDELRKAKRALDDDLSRMIYERLLSFQETTGGLIPDSAVVELQVYEQLNGLKKLTRCEVSTNLTLW